ncbi:MAG: cell division protein FtsQ/DivIB [Wenzhouxiangellaceae bacterium]
MADIAQPLTDLDAATSEGLAPRRLVWLVVSACVLLLAVWLRLGIVGGHWWPIQWLEVSGSFQRVSPEMVRAALMPALGRGYFSLDMAQLNATVAELPWVAESELRRRWPDTLHVTIIEHEPVAYWRDGAVISQTGEVFTLQGQVLIQGLPRLFGPQGQKDAVVAIWRDIQTALNSAGLVLAELHVSERGAVWLRLDNGLHVELGRLERQRRMRRLVAALPQLRGHGGELPLRVDMRYSNGLAVEWPVPPMLDEVQVSDNG